MPKTEIAVTVDAALLEQLDLLIAEAQFPNRSQAVEAALAEKLDRMRRTRLARECAKLDPDEERAWAEEGLGADLELWPEY
jgi:metal-responsive CopG/Arc/MetJ family transcriptional regulator